MDEVHLSEWSTSCRRRPQPSITVPSLALITCFSTYRVQCTPANHSMNYLPCRCIARVLIGLRFLNSALSIVTGRSHLFTAHTRQQVVDYLEIPTVINIQDHIVDDFDANVSSLISAAKLPHHWHSTRTSSQTIR